MEEFGEKGWNALLIINVIVLILAITYVVITW